MTEFLPPKPEPMLRRTLADAPVDNEPLTDEDWAAIREGLEERAAGKTVPHEVVKRFLRTVGADWPQESGCAEAAALGWSLDDPPLDDEPLTPEDEAALANPLGSPCSQGR